jgi:hypothetical protein
MSANTFYTPVKLPGNDEKPFIMVRITSGGRIEAMYEQTRGPVHLLRWDSYVASGHYLARFTQENAEAYANYENYEATSDNGL